MLGLRVAALLLLCSTPGSATEEDLSTGIKAKLEQIGVDSMPKRVHTWTTRCRVRPPRQTTAQHPNCPHIPLQAGVGGVAGLVGGYLAKQTQAASMHTAHALHVHPHMHRLTALIATPTALPQDAVLNACLIGGVVAGG